MDKFTLAYIEAALWASNDESDEKGGEPLDANYGISDIGPGTLAEMIDDCKRFQEENAADIAAGPDGPDYTRYERAGHDFLLTRNHHGAGFWDGDWPEEVGERLTAASHAYGEVNLYVGDDGLIYA
jgi:hypothetical protein